MIRSLELGVAVLQWRDTDDSWRVVDVDQLADERAGRFTPAESDWTRTVNGFGINGGATYVYGAVADGVPDRVTVDDEEVPVQTLAGVWAAAWTATRPRIVVYVNGDEVVLDMSRPHFR